MKRLKKFKWILIALVVAFVVAQFFNPQRTNPPVVNDFVAATKPPQDLQNIFHAACYDCHSHETKWPWYSRVAPMSFGVASDVEYGRANLNLSDWPTNSVRAAKRLDAMSEAVSQKEMPLPKYLLIHRDARLTDTQRKQLSDWLDAQSEKLQPQ